MSFAAKLGGRAERRSEPAGRNSKSACKNSRQTAFPSQSLFLVKAISVVSYRFLPRWHRGCGQKADAPCDRRENSQLGVRPEILGEHTQDAPPNQHRSART